MRLPAVLAETYAALELERDPRERRRIALDLARSARESFEAGERNVDTAREVLRAIEAALGAFA